MKGALDGRHAVITGGGSGIGAAVADALAGQGAKLTLVGRSLEKLQKKAATLKGAHVAAHVAAADVTDAAAVAAAIESGVKVHGPVAILVNNAGAAPSRKFLDTDLATWRQTLDVNMTGAFLCAQAVLPGMIAAKWGRIVNVASVVGLIGYKGIAAYVAAKHGLVGLTRALALEYADLGITVNAVCPNFTDTDMVAQAVANIRAQRGVSETEARAMLAGKNPQKRLVTPAEVASAVAWLCQPESASMNGHALPIDGGEIIS
ncbi:MAG: SDR family oxidoreductase [Rhodospirillaceae bacterium]|nr:SDR family oxidoreductase [Rhodospirillaceae bacterium]